MKHETPKPSQDDATLDRVVADYILARDRGESVDAEALAERHPPLGDALREFVADYEAFRSAAATPPDATRTTPRFAPGTRLGDYEIIEEVARGGMGVVFRARQSSLDRIVALKCLAAGALASDEAVGRFRREATVAGGLHHPGIVPVYDAGEFEGHHYLVMRYVDGGTLATERRRLITDPRSAARILERIARAVQHAHAGGVIHRDLKPSNVLIERDGTPRISDFGLSKHATAQSVLTLSGAVIGTPSYMAPEQLGASAARDTAAVDIYGLGAILFELLTDRPPFQGESAVEIIAQVRRDDPPRPRSLDRRIPTDLETICLKCLEKQPKRRYADVAALIADLNSFLDGRSIQARPVSWPARAWRTCRRYPILCGLSATTLAALIALAAGLWIAHLSDRERLFESLVAQARATSPSGRPGQRLQSLDALRRAVEIRADPRLRDDVLSCLGSIDVELVGRRGNTMGVRTPSSLWHAASSVGVDRALSRSVRVTAGGGICVEELGSAAAGTSLIEDVAVDAAEIGRDGLHHADRVRLSPDGRFVAIRSSRAGEPALSIWELSPTARRRCELVGDFSGPILWSPPGRVLSATASGLRTYDLDRDIASVVPLPVERVVDMALRPDGAAVAVVGGDCAVIQIVDVENGERLATVEGYREIRRLTWRPDGEVLAIGIGSRVRLATPGYPDYDVSLLGHDYPVTDVVFHPTGNLVFTASMDMSVRVWDSASGEELLRLDDRALVAVSSDGGRLACVDPRGAIETWRIVHEGPWRAIATRSLRPHFRSIAVHSGGRLAAVGGAHLELLDLDAARCIGRIPAGITTFVAFESIEGGLLVWGPRGLGHWRLNFGETTVSGVARSSIAVGPRRPVRAAAGSTGPGAASRDGRVLALSSFELEPTAVVILDWTRPDSERVVTGPPWFPQLAVSADGRLVGVAGRAPYGIRVFDAQTADIVFQQGDTDVDWVVFTAAHDRLVYGRRRLENVAVVVDTTTRETISEIALGSAAPGAAAASPHGAVIAIRTGLERLCLVDAITGRVLCSFRIPGHRGAMVFDPEGSRLLVSGLGSFAYELDFAAAGRTVLSAGLPWEITEGSRARRAQGSAVALDLVVDESGPPGGER